MSTQDIRSVAITFANTGIVLRTVPDELPITGYKALINVITDRENSISVRKGFDRLNDGLPSAPYSIFYLKDMNGYQWRYCIAGGKLYVAPVEDPESDLIWPLNQHTHFQAVIGGSNLSAEPDPRALFASYTLIGREIKPYSFMTDGTAFIKHSGGATSATRIGIPRPTHEMTVSANTGEVTQNIEDFETAGSWTLDNATVAASTPPTEIISTNALKVITTGDGATGSIKKAITVGGYPVVANLGITADKTIELWVKFTDEEASLNLSQFVISFGLSHIAGDITFQTRYERAFVPSSFQAATIGGSGGRTITYTGSTPESVLDIIFGKVLYDRDQGAELLTYLRNNGFLDAYPSDLPTLDPIYIRGLLANKYGLVWDPENPTFGDPRDNTGEPTVLPPSAGVWIRQRINQEEFKRVGRDALTAPDLNWTTVTAIRIDCSMIAVAKGGKTLNLEFDNCVLLTTGQLFGWDYQWAYTFYNSKTNTESDYSPAVAVPAPGAQYDSYTLTIPTLPSTTPPKANPDFVRLYRMGGTVTQFQLVDIEIPYVAGTSPVVTDDQADALLGQPLEVDNQLPMNAVSGIELYDDRLWTWGGYYTSDDGLLIPEPPNRLRFSKAVRVEHFPAGNYIYVGTGSEQIQRVMENDAELFVFTLTRVYRVIGSGGAYRAVTTPVNQGLKSKFGIIRGLRSLYMHAYDGVYEFPSGRKISEPINQVFFGQRLNDIDPISIGRETECCMGFWDSKVYFSYPANQNIEIKNNRILVWDTIYERWHYYLYGAYCYFTEPENNILIGGTIVSSDDAIEPSEDPTDYRYSGAWPMQLEMGYADHCQEGYLGIYWAVDTKDYDLGAPDQEKRFIDFVLDVDTQGVPVLFEAAFDDAMYDPIGVVQTAGRERVILPVLRGEGESKLAVRCQIRIIATTSASSIAATRLYKIAHRILLEPQAHRTFVTDWSDYGNPGSKFLRELWLELDTFGKTLASLEVQVDGQIAQTFTDIVANGRHQIFRAMDPDLRGRLIRLKFIPSGDALVKIWSHDFKVIPEPPEIENIQTSWSDEGAPNQRKRYRKMIVEADNVGPSGLTVDAQVDNASVSITSTGINVSEHGRTEYVFSFEPDTVGILWRALITVNDPGSTFRFYRAWVEALPEPLQEWRYESPWANNGTDQEKRLRDLVIEADTVGDDVVVTPWVDGAALPDAYTVNTKVRSRVCFSLPVDTIGKITRITAIGDHRFTIYGHDIIHFDDSIQDTIIETPWNDQGAPNQKKRFRNLIVEVNNLGPGGITVNAQIDNASMTTTPTRITALGRSEYTFSFEPDSVGILWRVILTSDSGSVMRFWRAWVEAIPEPFEQRRFESPWTNNGTDNEKRLRDLVIEADTRSHNVTITVWVDGSALPDTFLLNTPDRQKVVFSLPVDLIGKITRITATSGYWFTIYVHEFAHFADAIENTIIEMPWSDEGAPNQKKRFRKLMVEVNNLGPGAVTVEAQIDNATVLTTPDTITALGRSEYVFSFDPDTVGILWRVILRSEPGSQMRFWRAWVEAIPEPFHEWRYESPWANNGTDQEKRLRDLIIEADTTGDDVIVTAWVDGAALPDTFILNTPYRERVVYSLPVDLIGKITRITAVANQRFTIYGSDFAHFDDSIENTVIETPWSNEGAPNQRKRFRKLLVEVNNLGPGGIIIDTQVDNRSVTTIPTYISDLGRDQYSFSFEPDTVGILWRVILRSETGSQMRFWKAWVEAIPEPFQEYRHESPWTDQGISNQKRLRDVILEGDTGGHNVTITVWVDGYSLPDTFTLATSARSRVVFSLPIDTIGKIMRITATSGFPFTIYEHEFKYFEDSIEETIIEMPWVIEEWPYKKLWKEVVVQADTGGQPATLTFWLDGVVTAQTFTFSHAGRLLSTFSLAKDTIGKLARVTFSAKIMRNYSVNYVIDKLPPDVTLADTWTQIFNYDRYKILRRLWLSMTNPNADVNFEIWIDNILRHSGNILANPSPDPSFSKRKIDLTSAKKGKLFRLIFSSTSAFGIFWDKSEIELKDLNMEDGYRREKMAPPQTY
jgi:hypothetical protein